MEIVADQQRAEFLEQQDQRKRQKNLIEMLAVIEMAKEKAFEQHAEPDAGEDRDGQRQPQRAGGAHHQKRRVGAHHEQAAVRQIDDPQHAEDEREAARDQEQQQPVLHAIE